MSDSKGKINLISLHVTLLAKLLSGELSVADAEEVVHHPEK